MRVKVDEDLPNAVVRLLRARGLDAATVLEEGYGGYKDPALWRVVQSERRFLVTADKGFGDIRVYPPGQHAGILLLRPDEMGIRPVLDLLSQVLSHCHLGDLEGTIAVATRRGLRVRRGADKARPPAAPEP